MFEDLSYSVEENPPFYEEGRDLFISELGKSEEYEREIFESWECERKDIDINVQGVESGLATGGPRFIG